MKGQSLTLMVHSGASRKIRERKQWPLMATEIV